MRGWIFQGNPRIFRLNEYLSDDREYHWWTIRQRHLANQMNVGDQVFIWRADGDYRGSGGIVAVGTISGEAAEAADDAPELWTDPARGAQVDLMVPLAVKEVRLSRNEAMVPRSAIESEPLLSDLRILRYRSETNYPLTDAQLVIVQQLWNSRSTGQRLPLDLIKGSEYRRSDMHAELGGQKQGGISTPVRYPVVLLFTGQSGLQHGYRDGAQEDGYFHYTGEGQFGDMALIKGNLAIANHRSADKALYLLQQTASRGMYVCLGEFEYVDHKTVTMPDTAGTQRNAIVFRLREIQPVLEDEVPEELDNNALGFNRLRAAALRAASPSPTRRHSLTESVQRSRQIRRYVVRRSNGFCEFCGTPAQFTGKDGRPYLEAHHAQLLAQDGADHPAAVLSLCPNCHRRAHYAGDADRVSREMLQRARALESAIGREACVVVTAVVLMNAVGMVWLGQRKSANLDGQWEFPGGKAKSDETLEQCLRREIQEELGVGLAGLVPFTLVDHEYPNSYVRLYVYVGGTGTAGLKLTLKDHAKGLWYRLSDVPLDSLAEADREVLRRLKARFLASSEHERGAESPRNL